MTMTPAWTSRGDIILARHIGTDSVMLASCRRGTKGGPRASDDHVEGACSDVKKRSSSLKQETCRRFDAPLFHACQSQAPAPTL